MDNIPVSFIGAGPGDPDLLTVKALNRIKEADVIIYAGSLVNPGILKYAKTGARIYDSKSMILEEITEIIIGGVKGGSKVVRLQTGDISLYSSLIEQISPLEKAGIGIEIIPGVSSFQAAAARVKREYTVPGGTQTLILSRISGKTGVPSAEEIERLVEHRTSIVFFLSMGKFESLIKKVSGKLPLNTPVAVCYKVTWPEEIIVEGRLDNIIEKVSSSGIKNKTALILIGSFLKPGKSKSRLYDKEFSHEYRKRV